MLALLILGEGLNRTGALDSAAKLVNAVSQGRPIAAIGLTLLMVCSVSAVLNNIPVVVLFIPIMQALAVRSDRPSGRYMMPLSFAAILGGMTTLVGTPPNLIVSGFREEAGLGQFAMFDFAPVGIAVATLGVLFVALIGWRLVPARKSAAGANFDTGTYLTEVRVPANGKAVGLTLRSFEAEIEDSGAQIVGLVRNEVHMTAPHGARRIHAGDVLVLQADVDALTEALSVFGIELEAQKAASDLALIQL